MFREFMFAHHLEIFDADRTIDFVQLLRHFGPAELLNIAIRVCFRPFKRRERFLSHNFLLEGHFADIFELDLRHHAGVADETQKLNLEVEHEQTAAGHEGKVDVPNHLIPLILERNEDVPIDGHLKIVILFVLPTFIIKDGHFVLLMDSGVFLVVADEEGACVGREIPSFLTFFTRTRMGKM